MRGVTLRERAWGLALAAVRPLLPAAGIAGPKAAAATAGRRTAAASLQRWAAGRSRPGRRLWLHGASAGELLGAAPVVGRLRDREPVELLVTYTSPSAEEALPALEPDGAEFAPLDTPGDCRRSLRAVAPSALVFAKGDLWPSLTAAAARAGVPLGMVNATVAPDSSRLHPAARALLRPGYGRLRRVGAATRRSAERLRRLGVRGEALEVTGDAAADRALDESSAGELPGPARRLSRSLPEGRPVVVAGSTWPSDEELLVKALARIDARGSPTPPVLVLVPHEPGRGARERVEAHCRARLGSGPAVWGAGGEPTGATGADVVLVNRTGLLSGLYPAGDVAWVGGGMGEDGLHSVVEPAAAGVPVLFGPRGGRWEARELLDRDAAWRLPPGSGADELARVVTALLEDDARRKSMGERARAVAEANAGAAERGADLVTELLDAGA